MLTSISIDEILLPRYEPLWIALVYISFPWSFFKDCYFFFFLQDELDLVFTSFKLLCFSWFQPPISRRSDTRDPNIAGSRGTPVTEKEKSAKKGVKSKKVRQETMFVIWLFVCIQSQPFHDDDFSHLHISRHIAGSQSWNERVADNTLGWCKFLSPPPETKQKKISMRCKESTCSVTQAHSVVSHCSLSNHTGECLFMHVL